MAVTDKLKEMVEELRQDVGEMKGQLRQLVSGKDKSDSTLPVRHGGRDDHPLVAWQRDTERLLDQLWRGTLRPSAGSASPFSDMWGFEWPQVDIDETDTEVRVAAELPGLDQDDVDVTVADGVLTIRGEKRHEDERSSGHRYQRECFYGSFARSVPIPGEVDIDGITAKMKKGTLRISMPKLEGSKRRGRTITISS
jgi:HSP20 family protein